MRGVCDDAARWLAAAIVSAAARLGGGPRRHLDRCRSVARFGFSLWFHTSDFGWSYRGDLHRHDHPMLVLQSSASASATSLGPRSVDEGRAS